MFKWLSNLIHGPEDEEGEPVIPKPPKWTADDYQSAALEDDRFRFMHNIYSSGMKPSEVESYREKLTNLREYSKTLVDPRWRKAYLDWCNFIERKLNDAERNWKASQERAASGEQSKYEERRAEKERRIRALIRSCPPQ